MKKNILILIIILMSILLINCKKNGYSAVSNIDEYPVSEFVDILNTLKVVEAKNTDLSKYKKYENNYYNLAYVNSLDIVNEIDINCLLFDNITISYLDTNEFEITKHLNNDEVDYIMISITNGYGSSFYPKPNTFSYSIYSKEFFQESNIYDEFTKLKNDGKHILINNYNTIIFKKAEYKLNFSCAKGKYDDIWYYCIFEDDMYTYVMCLFYND